MLFGLFPLRYLRSSKSSFSNTWRERPVQRSPAFTASLISCWRCRMVNIQAFPPSLLRVRACSRAFPNPVFHFPLPFTSLSPPSLLPIPSHPPSPLVSTALAFRGCLRMSHCALCFYYWFALLPPPVIEFIHRHQQCCPLASLLP